jgi:hypothetical protein
MQAFHVFVWRTLDQPLAFASPFRSIRNTAHHSRNAMHGHARTSVPDRSAALSQAVVETARRLALSPTEMAEIVGVSQPIAFRLLQGDYSLRESGNEWDLSVQLIRLSRSLLALVGEDDMLARGWLRSTNSAFSGQQPIDVIKRIDGLLHACEYLDAQSGY